MTCNIGVANFGRTWYTTPPKESTPRVVDVVNRVKKLCMELGGITTIVHELVNFLHLACHYSLDFPICGFNWKWFYSWIHEFVLCLYKLKCLCSLGVLQLKFKTCRSSTRNLQNIPEMNIANPESMNPYHSSFFSVDTLFKPNYKT